MFVGPPRSGKRLEEMRVSFPGDPGVPPGDPWGLSNGSRNLFVTVFLWGFFKVSSDSQKFFRINKTVKEVAHRLVQPTDSFNAS